MLRSPASSMKALVHKFWRDVTAVAAVEFGLLAPLLLLMTFGTIELSRALIIHQRFQRATSMVGDLVTREKQFWDENITSPDPKNTANYPYFGNLSRQTLAGIMTAAQHSMRPYLVTPLNITVYQVWANPTNPMQAKVEWSYAYNWATTATTRPQCGDTISIDQNVLLGGGRAVYVTGRYAFTPLLTNLLPNVIRSMTWTDTMVMAPRDVPSVMYLPGLNNGADWSSMSTAACSN